MIFELIQMILVLLLGTNNKPTYDLHKRESRAVNMNRWAQKYYFLIAVLVILAMFIVFIVAVFVLVGPSATESGLVYNQFDKVI